MQLMRAKVLIKSKSKVQKKMNIKVKYHLQLITNQIEHHAMINFKWMKSMLKMMIRVNVIR